MAVGKKLVLPRGYISWSAYNLYKRDKIRYIKQYFYGIKPTFTNSGIEFGHQFAVLAENGRKSDDPLLDAVLTATPKLKKPEFKIDVILPTERGDVVLKGQIDDFDNKNYDFNEFKTGRRKWTFSQANKHGQMKFYTLMIFLKYGVIPKNKNLIWIETEEVPVYNEHGGIERYEVRPTGHIVKFPVIITPKQLNEFAREVTNAVYEIAELYEEFRKENI